MHLHVQGCDSYSLFGSLVSSILDLGNQGGLITMTNPPNRPITLFSVIESAMNAVVSVQRVFHSATLQRGAPVCRVLVRQPYLVLYMRHRRNFKLLSQ